MKPRILIGLLLLSAVSIGVNVGAAADTGIKADIVKTRDLIEFRKNPAILRLEHKGGSPVMPEELEYQHGAQVHVFMVDPTLSDFHHLYPNPMESAPGNYIYTVTPKTACGYRVWANVKPKSGAESVARVRKRTELIISKMKMAAMNSSLQWTAVCRSVRKQRSS